MVHMVPWRKAGEGLWGRGWFCLNCFELYGGGCAGMIEFSWCGIGDWVYWKGGASGGWILKGPVSVGRGGWRMPRRSCVGSS